MRKLIMCISLVCFAASAQAEPVTIAALGDSLTQGYGLVQQDGFVPQLENWLTLQGVDVVLINAGVSGDTTAGGAARVAWTLTPDVDAMIVALGGNDLLRGIDPDVSRANLSAILDEATKTGVRVLLIGMEAPGNFGPEYKATFEANYAELAQQYGVLFMPRFFEGISADTTDPAAMRPYLQGDGIHPNAQGVSLIVQAVGPKVLELVEQTKPN